jgi:hypothetical protein
MNDNELTERIGRRIESRYRRLCFVQKEFVKLNAAAKQYAEKESVGTSPSGSSGGFEDFVFAQIDFSVYKKIDVKEFSLIFEEGLEDYDEAFFIKAFGIDRKAVQKTIETAYIKIGPFRVCKKADPLLLSIMRTLHTSLEFAPILRLEEVASEEQYRALIAALDGVEIRHSDGMMTRLFSPKDGTGLCGTFYPQGKAHTIKLL